jgi:hypothetical protein
MVMMLYRLIRWGMDELDVKLRDTRTKPLALTFYSSWREDHLEIVHTTCIFDAFHG